MVVHNDEYNVNSTSKLSLSNIRYRYSNSDLTLDEALSYYPEWVKIPHYMVMHAPDLEKPIPPECNRNFVSFRELNKHECKYRLFKLAKRGNDVYSWKVKQRFLPLSILIQGNKEFRFIENHKRYANSEILWVTLTYDTNRCDKEAAWINIGDELNNFFSNLKSKYGKILVLRCFEAFKNGYPHICLIIQFIEYEFFTKRYTDKKEKMRYIIKKDDEINLLRSYWHSYSRYEGIQSLGAIGYLLKYITKVMYEQNNYSTSAYLWFFRKRSYSMSKNFIVCLSNKAGWLLDSISSNSNFNSEGWQYLCTIRLNNPPDEWNFDLEKPPPFEQFLNETEDESLYRTIFETYLNGNYYV